VGDGKKGPVAGTAAGARVLAGGGAVDDGAGWRCHGEWDKRTTTCREFFFRARLDGLTPVAYHCPN